MIKSNLIIILTSGLLTGPVVAADLMASIDQTKSTKDTTVPIRPETLVDKANVSPSDANITIEVLRILKQADALDVAVVSKQSKVTLIGFVPSSKDRNRIITLVENVEGVQEVKAEALAVSSLNPGFGR